MSIPTLSSGSSHTASRAVTEIEEYVRSSAIDQVLKRVLKKCFRAQPEDPIIFMVEHLLEQYPHVAAAQGLDVVQDTDTKVESDSGPGRCDADATVAEVSVEHGGDDGVRVAVTHPDPEVAAYLNDHLSVASLFEAIAEKLAEVRPERPLQHIVDLLALAGDGESDVAHRGSDSNNESVISDEFEELPCEMPTEEDQVGDIRPRLMSRDPSGIDRSRRSSVSAECVTMNASGDLGSPPRTGAGRAGECRAPETTSLLKTDAEKASIVAVVRANILFKDLDQCLLNELVDSIFPAAFPRHHVIIKQGDEGENFYIIVDGEAEAHVRSKVIGQPPTKVQHLRAGSSFGELSLLYNSPRAATVTAATDIKLWALDRCTFRRIVSTVTQRARHMHEGFLEQVPILSTLTSAERSRLADAIETCTYAKGEAVVKQGEKGDAFYIVEEGEAAAEISFQAVKDTADHSDEHPQCQEQQQLSAQVKRYGPGDYFGELSLITDKPRAATVQAVSDRLVCVAVSKASFARLMGSCEKVMMRNIESYKRIMMELAFSSGAGSH